MGTCDDSLAFAAAGHAHSPHEASIVQKEGTPPGHPASGRSGGPRYLGHSADCSSTAFSAHSAAEVDPSRAYGTLPVDYST